MAILDHMKSKNRRHILVPPDLLPAIQAAAEEEQREPHEVVGEAVERYLSERRWFRKDEVHMKIAQGLESLRQGKGLDGETVMAELLAGLDASDHER
jgi:predicted transcriptional regulator